jgi:cytochrome P450
MTVAYNPFAPEVKENPYPYYARLRAEAPVYCVDPLGLLVVSRYDDVIHVLRNPQLFSSSAMGAAAMFGGETEGPRGATIISADPPEHTRIRNVVNRAFNPRTIDQMGPRIREITDELLGRTATKGEFDLVADLAMPLPVIVIAEMLGVEPAHREEFKRWSDDIVRAMGGTLPDEERAGVRESMQEFRDYFEEVIEKRRREPQDDLISVLVRAETEGQTLSPDEVLAFAAILLVAGNETTTNLIGNAVLALLEHPDQLAKVLADRTLIPNLIEEALRYDAPVQGLFRRATQDVEVAGTVIPEGAVVMPLYASANRDERRFPDPARFDVTRDVQGHVAFGYGIHFCLGAPLARLEAKIALEALLSRFQNLARTKEHVERINSFFLRGPKSLPLKFSTAKPVL